jgi:branched-subunit amino acid aminotransferase/4-amino-4-deoxychorismate lyase
MTINRELMWADGFFDTQRWAHFKCPFWKMHWSRIERNASQLGFVIPKEEILLAQIEEFLKGQNLIHIGLRLNFRRTEGRGLFVPQSSNVKCQLEAVDLPDYKSSKFHIGIRVFDSNFLNPIGLKKEETKVKTYQYLSGIEALREAQNLGFDDVLLVNSCGEFVEAAFANVFVLNSQKKWAKTPPASLGSDAFSGITRLWLIDILRADGWTIEESNLSGNEQIDEMVLTSSLRGIMPVSYWKNQNLKMDLGRQFAMSWHQEFAL